jgi:hypothetical protein
MLNSIYTQILRSTSQNLNMTTHFLKADAKRLAEYWEVALEQGNINDINVAILFLDTGIHGYLKAKGIDLGNKKTPKRSQDILNSMILLITMYVLDQPKDLFPKIHELTPINEQDIPEKRPGEDIILLAEKILYEKSDPNSGYAS